MVEQLPYHLKVKGSSPGAAVGTGFRENGKTDRIAHIRHQCSCLKLPQMSN